MYLSRLILNPRSRLVRRDLSDCQQMHRTIMACFAQTPARGVRAEFGVLHRVEINPHTGRVIVYVQSAELPDWSRLPSGYLAQAADTKPVSERYAAIANGMVLAFRLRANPTRKIDTKSGPDGRRRNGRRVDLRGEEAQLGWLVRKAAAHGFRLITARTTQDLPDVRVLPQGQAVGSVAGVHPAGRMTFGSVLFEGHLQVVDADRFREALAHGIGSGKAYGFGLLSVAPVGSGLTP